jgi:hypothetical protein
MKKTEAIKRFLTAKTHPDLAELYDHALECQVNVGQDGGERIQDEYRGKRWVGWTDSLSGEVWKPFRIPWNANSEPKYEDTELSYNSEHFEAIGMTGWNWVDRCSLWVGYDFDAIIGHSEKHEKKLTDKELVEIEDTVRSIPWITLRYSTSGKGRHIYVFLDRVPTNNHSEHAALARAILGMLAGITGYDFATKVDQCGSNLWVWHRRMTGNGLKLIKQGTILDEVPPNWQEHLDVIRNKRSRIVPRFIDDVDSFDDLVNQKSIVPLDEKHKQLMNWLSDGGYYCQWDNDNRMLITHSYYLELAHKDLNLLGVYDTIAQGTEGTSDYNSFCYPNKKGAWVVRRYSKGVAEAPCWSQDAGGWTRCYYNQVPDFDTACRHFGGVLMEKGGYSFNEAEMASTTAKALGLLINELPHWLLKRKCILKKSKDGNLVMSLAHESSDNPNQLNGWHLDKKVWTKVYPARLNQSISEPDTQNYDDIIRNLVNEDNVFVGWFIRTERNVWTKQPIENMRPALISMGVDERDLSHILGSGVMKNWRLVNRPFEPEYLPDRQWNKNGAKMLFQPSGAENPQFPTWNKIFTHLGKGLDATIRQHPWCKENAITSGAEYLKIWVAALFQKPLRPAPYLFLYSEEQNTGKSAFYESLQLLISDKAVIEGKIAIESKNDFSGELANAVLCYVNEVNLAKTNDKGSLAYNRIKNWVTGMTITIHPKGKDPYQIPNSVHWVQTGNDPSYCPIFPGDTRITMIHVNPIPQEEIIPPHLFRKQLEKEAPDFMQEILSLEIPESNDRLIIPVVDTEEKKVAEQANTNPLHLFMNQECHYVPGKSIRLGEVTERFKNWLREHEVEDVDYWTSVRVGKELPKQFGKARSPRDTNQVHVINISFDKPSPDEPQLKRLGIDPKGNIFIEGDSI